MRNQTHKPDSALAKLLAYLLQPTCWLTLVYLLLQGTGVIFASNSTPASGTIAVDAFNSIVATADRSGLVRLFDVTVPDHPALLSKFTVPRDLTGVALAGDSLLVSGQGGVQILDISDPKSPQMRSSVDLGAEATTVKAAGNLGYTAFGSTVVLFNIDTGEILSQHNYSDLEVNDLALSADSLYVLSADPDGAAGIAIVKVQVSGSLNQPIASWTSADSQPAMARLSLYAAGDLIYVSAVVANTGERVPGLEVLQDLGASLKSIGLPSQINSGTVRPSGGGLLAFTGLINQGDAANRLGILDITEPSRTDNVLKTLETSGPAYDVTLHGQYAYVAAGSAGLQVIAFVSPSGVKRTPSLTLDTSAIVETPQAGSLVRLTAAVTAADQVRKVDFYVNGTVAASDGNYPFEYRFMEADAGSASSFSVYACVEDIDSNTACTAPTALGTKSNSGLKVVSVSPAANAHTPHSSKLSVTAQFSQPLDANTVAPQNVTVTRLAAGKTPASTIAMSGVSYLASSRSLVIQPKSPLTTGAYKVTLGSAIKGTSGSALTSGYSWTFNVDAATDTWTNPEGGDWSVGTNWSLGTAPAAGDSAVISLTGVTVTMSASSGNVDLAALTVGATNTLNISGGSLSIEGGDTATISGNLNFSSGMLGGPGTTTVSGKMDWTGGAVTGVLVIQAKAVLAINTTANTTFNLSGGGILNNSGTVNQSFVGTPGSYSGFQVFGSGVINNLAGGVWNLESDTWMQTLDSSAVAFNNAGTLNKAGGTNTSIWSVPITGAGAINIEEGDLNLNGNLAGNSVGKLAAPIAISAKAILDYGQGGVLDGSKVTGAGTMNFNASTTVSGAYAFAGLTQIQSGSNAITFQNATSIAALNLSSGTLAGPGPVTVSGTMNWTGGGVSGVLDIPAKAVLEIKTTANTSFFLKGGGILNNSGTVNQSFVGTPGSYSGFQVSQGGVINNLAGSVWNLTTDVWMQTLDSSAVAFNNAGTFNKAGGSNTTIWSLPFTGAGAINIDEGDLDLNGNLGGNVIGKLAAPIAISAKAILDYGQGGVLDGSKVTGSGTMNFNAATTVSGAYTFAGLTQIQSGSNAVTFENPTTIATLNLRSGTLAGSGPVTVSGTTIWTGGGVSGVLDIPAKATLEIETTANTSFFLNGGGILNNSGTVNQSFVGTPGSYSGFQVFGSGVINNLAGGVWNLESDIWMQSLDSSAVAFNNAGTLNKAGGTNTSIWSVPITGAGAINIEEGDLNLNGNLAGNSVGKLAAPIAISAKAILDYGQGGTLDGSKVTGAGTMNFNASTTVSGAYAFAGLTQIQSGSNAITFQNATSIAALNLSSGTLAGPGPVTVSGTMNWTGGGVSGVLDIPAKAVLEIKTTSNTSFFLKGGGILNNSGTVNQSFVGTPGSYSGFQVSQGGVINNLAGSVWNLTTDVWMQTLDSSAVAFNNAGTFNKAGGSNTTIWSLPFTGAGAINIDEGDLDLNGNLGGNVIGKLAAPIAISAKAILDYGQGGVLDGSKVTGSGTMNFNAATTVSGAYTFAGLTQIQSGSNAINFQDATSIAALNLLSGILAGPGPVTVTGTTNWTGGGVTGVLDIPAKAVLNITTTANTSFFLNAGGIINNGGTVNQSFVGTPGSYSGFQVSGGAVINNLVAGVWNLLTDVWTQNLDATSSFNNAGTVNKNAGTNTSLWSIAYNNTGTLNVNSGTLTLNGTYANGVLSGNITVGSSGVLNYAQQGKLSSGTASGTGTFNISASTGTTTVTGTYKMTVPAQILGGTLTVSAGASLNASSLTLSSATLSVGGSTSIGNLNVTAASGAAPSNVNGAGTISISDTLNWGSGKLNVTGSINTQSLTLSPNSALSFQLGSSALSINAKLSLNGTLTVTLPSTNPSVGKVFKVLNFDNGFLGSLLNSLLDIPIPGTNDHLTDTFSTSGLSLTVAANPSQGN